MRSWVHHVVNAGCGKDERQTSQPPEAQAAQAVSARRQLVTLSNLELESPRGSGSRFDNVRLLAGLGQSREPAGGTLDHLAYAALPQVTP